VAAAAVLVAIEPIKATSRQALEARSITTV
jgi:hypothetical protein